jgi:DNA topoisomerase-3
MPKKGTLIKGKSAWLRITTSGCTFYYRLRMQKKKYLRISTCDYYKGSTNLKISKTESGIVEGLLRFDVDFQLN